MINAIIIVAIATTIELLCNSDQLGQLTLFINSSYDSLMYVTLFAIFLYSLYRTGGETRTPNQWFWRPLLYQLSYTRLHWTAIHNKYPSPTI